MNDVAVCAKRKFLIILVRVPLLFDVGRLTGSVVGGTRCF